MSALEHGVSVVTPVYRNEDTLADLAERVAAALPDRPWRLRFVVDASPDDSLVVARRLASGDPRIGVTALSANVGQHRAVAAGLAAEAEASAWVCLDADLQDPPEAVPALLDLLTEGDVGAVFAGRRGRYESRVRLATGGLHRVLLSRLCHLPPDAGAYVALGPAARDAVVRLRAPSIVAAIGAAGLPVASVPVVRAPRPSGRSAWRTSARLRQSVETLAWATRERVRHPAQRAARAQGPAQRAAAPKALPHDHRRLSGTNQQLRRADSVGGYHPGVDSRAGRSAASAPRTAVPTVTIWIIPSKAPNCSGVRPRLTVRYRGSTTLTISAATSVTRLVSPRNTTFGPTRGLGAVGRRS